ncbi:FAD-dependent oxidoreductase [Luteococcus peritonei]|uniref:FAD-dependent oxidoreductase n=1 Tax=Luteococcus peritonei TaxID=88874 RepID=A0ABW4RWD7_9ACTN
MTTSRHDVVVVGAGIAGLSCARALAADGHDVVVLEAQTQVGGRVATEQVDGFLVDRGFQVLNPAYPHLRRRVDMHRLGLRRFPREVRVRTLDGLAEVSDPSRRPDRLPRSLRSGLVRAGDVAALAAVARAAAGADLTRREVFDRAGFTTPLRHQVVDPFLAGVVCEQDGSTSARFTAWLLAMFAAGTPGLPSGGMATLPRIMAEDLDVRLGTRVEALDPATASLNTSEGDFSARAVVIAAGPLEAARLEGTEPVAVHATRSFWFATHRAPSHSPAIHLDGTGSGPVATTTVVSHLAPEYAPAGEHLVAALTVGESADEHQVRDHLGLVYGADPADWRLVREHHVPVTVPAVGPGAHRAGAGVRIVQRTITCGDQFGNASLDGAAASGRRAAREALNLLR